MEILDDKFRVWLDSAKFVKAIPGVFVLYNRNKEIIYIGESENLQQTFTKYVDNNFENDSGKQKTQSYQREFVEDPKERKRILLEDFKREHGKLPSCNQE
jgi:excinuclease UvrABC nuclease subunit